MNGGVVVDSQLEEEGEDHTRGEEEAGEGGKQSHLSLHDGHYGEEQRYGEHGALEVIFCLKEREYHLLVHHESVYVVAVGAHDGGEGEDSEAGEAIDVDEDLHEWELIIEVCEGEEAAEHEHACCARQELLPHHEVADGGLYLELEVFSYDAKAVEAGHVVGVHLANRLCLGYLDIYGFTLHLIVEQVEGHCHNEATEIAEGRTFEKASHEVHGRMEEVLVVAIEEIAEIEYQG